VLRANLSTGETLALDLTTQDDAGKWQGARGSPSFQATVRALSIAHGGQLHTLPLPKGHRSLLWDAALVLKGDQAVGERITCYADAISITVTVFWGQKVARVDVERIGRVRYTSLMAALHQGGAPERADSPRAR
jgi:hypothetical protein